MLWQQSDGGGGFGNSFGGVDGGAIPLLKCPRAKLRIDENIYQQTTIHSKKFVREQKLEMEVIIHGSKDLFQMVIAIHKK